MKRFFAVVLAGFLLGGWGVRQAAADEALRKIQQMLRNQGFYYGTIDGTPGDETTQALRRYQIRNGLTVNGQLTEETRQSIERNEAATASVGANSKPRPTPRLAPRPTPSVDEDRQYAQGRDDEAEVEDVPPARVPRGDRPDLRVGPGAGSSGVRAPRNGIAPSEALTTLLASTPYEFAPPPVQAGVLKRAQAILLRDGFYDGRVDGIPSALTADSLTNFQEVHRLRRSGRLDVNTLGLMRLLPGRQTVGPGQGRGNPDIIFQGRVVD